MAGVFALVARRDPLPLSFKPCHAGFLHRLGLKTGTDITQFGLESGMISRELQECKHLFVVSIPNKKKEQINMRIRNGL